MLLGHLYCTSASRAQGNADDKRRGEPGKRMEAFRSGRTGGGESAVEQRPTKPHAYSVHWTPFEVS